MRTPLRHALITAYLLTALWMSCALAETGGTHGNLVWSLDDSGVLTIDCDGVMYNYQSSTVPWAAERTKVKSVEFRGDIRTIGSYAFYGCSSLTSVDLPDTVTGIGAGAFSSCSALTDIHIPQSVRVIGNYAFFRCDSMASLHIDSVASWLSTTFEDESGSSIPNFSSSHCRLYINGTELTRIDIPEGVTAIPGHIFRNCKSLTCVTIPQSVETIGEYAFCRCAGLEKVDIAEGVRKIARFAFSVCKKLKEVRLPGTVRSIGSQAFYSCQGLTDITIPGSVTAIGPCAFMECYAMENVHIDDLAKWLRVDRQGDWANPARDSTVGCHLFIGDEELTRITVPDKVTVIDPNTFRNYVGLTEVILPDSVTTIGENAFYGCTALQSVNVPSRIRSIGRGAFSRCGSLTAIHIGSIASWLTASYTDESSHPNYAAPFCHLYKDGEELTYINVPDTVTAIGSYAFYNLSSIKYVSLPARITSIGRNAFNNCLALREIWWPTPDSVTIGDGALGYSPGAVTIWCHRSSKLADTLSKAGHSVMAIEDYDPKKDIRIFSPAGFSVQGGMAVTLPCVFFPTADGAELRYTSSDPAIGAVNHDGLFIGVVPGTVTVTVRSGAVSAAFSVTVTDRGAAVIALPGDLTVIGDEALSGLSQAELIIIPDGVTSIGGDALEQTGAVLSVRAGSPAETWAGEQGLTYVLR